MHPVISGCRVRLALQANPHIIKMHVQPPPVGFRVRFLAFLLSPYCCQLLVSIVWLCANSTVSHVNSRIAVINLCWPVRGMKARMFIRISGYPPPKRLWSAQFIALLTAFSITSSRYHLSGAIVTSLGSTIDSGMTCNSYWFVVRHPCISSTTKPVKVATLQLTQSELLYRCGVGVNVSPSMGSSKITPPAGESCLPAGCYLQLRHWFQFKLFSTN